MLKTIQILFWLKVADIGNRMLWASAKRIRDIANPWGLVTDVARTPRPVSEPVMVTEWMPRERARAD